MKQYDWLYSGRVLPEGLLRAGNSPGAHVRRLARVLMEIAGLAACYLVAAFVGLKFAIPPGNATAIWPPSGIALAGVLLLGPWASIGIWLGATLGNLTTAVTFPAAAAIGLGNALEALIGAALLRRSGRTARASFQDAKGVFVFATVAVVASVAAATVGVGVLRTAGHLPWSSLSMNWVTWWLGDIAGMVIVTPFLVSLWSAPRPLVSKPQQLEAGLAILALALVSQSLFGGLLEGALTRDLLYLPLVLLVWLALRFELHAVTTAALLMAVSAVWGTSRGVGAFGGDVVPASFFHLQIVMISYALASLALVATVNRRRRAESALLRLATALDEVGEGIMITDADATITHVNPAFELMTGYSRHEVVGKNPRLLQSGEHDAGFYRQLWATITRGDVWRGSLVDRRKDSALYDVDSTIAPIHEADGSLAGYVALSRDVTLQKKAERALRNSEIRLRTIFDSAADGIITVDEDGLIESSNPTVAMMFGHAIGDLIGRPISTLLAPKGREPSRVEETLRLGTLSLRPGVVKDVVGRRRDGATFRMDLMVNEVQLEGRRLFTGFLRDTTERHARLDAERSVLRTHEELRLARVIQQRFYPTVVPTVAGFDIAGVSHPAEQAGGDYFDYLPMTGGQLGLVIGDVSGHGLGPALLMSQTRACLRTLLLVTQDVRDLLTRLNAFLHADCGEEQFVTLFLARIDPLRRKLVYASGGHQSYLLRADGRVEILAATRIPLGMTPGPVGSAPELSLHPDDLLLMVTDGIEETESPGGCEMGRGRVLEVAQENRHRSAFEIVTALCAAASDFAAGRAQQDDITAVVAKVLN